MRSEIAGVAKKKCRPWLATILIDIGRSEILNGLAGDLWHLLIGEKHFP
jgi:hypothetical protein